MLHWHFPLHVQAIYAYNYTLLLYGSSCFTTQYFLIGIEGQELHSHTSTWYGFQVRNHDMKLYEYKLLI